MFAGVRRIWRSADEIAEVVRQIEAGDTDRAIARRTGSRSAPFARGGVAAYRSVRPGRSRASRAATGAGRRHTTRMALFTEVCDQLGVAWRPWGRFHISVARGEAVATLHRFIGPKA
jgi:hypothetical protein